MTYPIGGVDWALVQRTFHRWVLQATGLTADKVVWAQQDKLPRPPAPAVIMRLSNIAEMNQPWVDVEDNVLTFADKTVTAVDPATNTLTIAVHGFNNGDGPIGFESSGTLPSGLQADVGYWVVFVDANHVKLAPSFAATGGELPEGASNPVTVHPLGSTGTGTLKAVSTPDTRPAGAELISISRSYLRVTLELHAYTSDGVGMDMATSLLQRVRTRRKLPSLQQVINDQNIGLLEVDRIRAVLGSKDAVLFEPRAYLDAHFCVVSEEGETMTSIETIEIQNLITGKTVDVSVDGE